MSCSEQAWNFRAVAAECYDERLSDYQLLMDLCVTLVVHVVRNACFIMVENSAFSTVIL